MNYNKIILGGRLTRDPEMKYTQGGKAITKLGLAVSREWKSESGEKKKDTLFIDVDVFGKQAEVISQYFKKGSQIFVEGRLKLDSWEKDGAKHQKIGVVLEQFQFVDSKKDGDTPAKPAAPAKSKPADTDTDDVPF